MKQLASLRTRLASLVKKLVLFKKQLASLGWKEWNEVRVYLWIAMGVFVGLPVIGGFEEVIFQHFRQFEIFASPWVVAFGGVLAIFVAVGATCRDLSGPVEDFWRSRPVGIFQWLLVKYFVGLAVVLAACALPLALELAFNVEKSAALLLIWLPFMWAALYSIGFLAGCLVRRTAHAAMLALATMLLVYFLPVILPPLEWMNAPTVTESWNWQGSWPVLWDSQKLEFARGMLGLLAIVLILALLAVRCGWRIDSGRKIIYGAISSALLILFASAAFEMGTNLPILQQIDLPKGEEAYQLRYEGGHGYVVTEPQNDSDGWTYHSLESTSSGIKLGSAIKLSLAPPFRFTRASAPLPGQPEFIYYVDAASNGNREIYTLKAFTPGKINNMVITLLEADADMQEYFSLWAWKDRLYLQNSHLTTRDINDPTAPQSIEGSHLTTLDIGDPLQPKPISDIPFHFQKFFYGMLGGADKIYLELPQIPGLSPRDRLQLILNDHGFEGDTFCEAWGDSLLAYRLTNLRDATAFFQKVGQRETTMLERVFGSRGYNNGYQSPAMQNGLLYITAGGIDKLFNPFVTVLDTRGRQPLRPVGHFAAPGTKIVCPLADGRALVAGTKIWLVGPPPHRATN
jgi:hypothetical protein